MCCLSMFANNQNIAKSSHEDSVRSTIAAVGQHAHACTTLAAGQGAAKHGAAAAVVAEHTTSR